jgi:nucleotide-binding universal stress UspA family protein
MCSGEPAKVIVELARTQKTDLILMPTHGHGACRRFLLGSVTAKVLHDAECPVWTCTHLADKPASDPAGIRRVMCAVNFGPQSAKAIRWAADFASAFGAKLTLVHAVHPTPPELPERYLASWHEEARWGADEKLHALLRESGIQAAVLVVDGAATPKALGAAAQEQGAGLLVIARSCGSGMMRRLGSDAYDIICHSPCPVVTI